MEVRNPENGVARRLRTTACGCGNSDEWQRRTFENPPTPDALEIVQCFTTVWCKRGGRFGRIQTTSAPYSNNDVATGFAAESRAFIGCSDFGLAVYGPSNRVAQSHRCGPRTRNNECSPPEARNDLRQLPDFAAPEVNF